MPNNATLYRRRCFISELPFTLLHEIFSRLPIMGVVRCKCVCPTWNNLISTPSFILDYAKYSPFTALLFRVNAARLAFFLLEISDTTDYILTRIEQKFPYDDWMVTDSFDYLGPSNGLLCTRRKLVDRSDAVCVLNPIMGDTIQLPSCPEYVGYNCVAKYEFGFSPATNKFKVLRIVTKLDTGYRIVACEIFTIGVDTTWRRLPDPSLSLPAGSSSFSFKGFFHWIPCDRGPKCIFTFDLAEEKFGLMSVPPSSKPVYLVLLGDQLGLVDDSSLPSQVTIWKMKRHLVEESWTKVVILTSWFPPRVPTRLLIVVAELRNGDILFQCSDDCLVSCNVEQKRCSKIKCVGDGVKQFISKFMPGYSPNFALHASLLSRSGVIIKREIRSFMLS